MDRMTESAEAVVGGAPDGRASLVELDVRGAMPDAHADALAGIDRVLLYSVPLTTRFRRVTSRDGLLLHGPGGWGECAPFWDYDAGESAQWLRSALEWARDGGPEPIRATVPVNVTIPVESPEGGAARVRASGGCATAKVKVADPGMPIEDDAARVRAVAEALVGTVGDRARVRVDVNGSWSVDQALAAIVTLQEAAAPVGGLEYVEQPCGTVAELAEVRRRADGVPIAADESIRRADDPQRVASEHAADVAVVKVAPLGGVRRALQVGRDTGLDLVVSSALDTSIGLMQGVRAAACLPDLPHACGLATAQLLSADVVAPGESLLPVNGEIAVRDVAPDEALIGRTAPPDGLVDRWLARLAAMARVLCENGR